jgi:hypothetical protein
VKVQHALSRAGYNERTVINADSLLPIPGLEPDDTLATRFGLLSRSLTRRPLPNDDNIAVAIAGSHSGAGAVICRQGGIAVGGVSFHDHARFGDSLTGADVGDALHRSQAVGAIPPQTEAASRHWGAARPQKGDEEGIARLKFDGLSIYNETHGVESFIFDHPLYLHWNYPKRLYLK